MTARVDVAFTSTWYWENFVQYDTVFDSIGLNSIMRWIPQASREILLVINRDYVRPRWYGRFQDFHRGRRRKGQLYIPLLT